MVKVVRQGSVIRIHAHADQIATILGWGGPWVGLGCLAWGAEDIAHGKIFLPVLRILAGIVLVLWATRPFSSELAFDRAAGTATLGTNRPYFGTKRESWRITQITGLATEGGTSTAKWVTVWLVLEDGRRVPVGGAIGNDSKAPPQVHEIYAAVREATGRPIGDPPPLRVS
jgi:hypothetical protein